jgi:hypothetical protein
MDGPAVKTVREAQQSFDVVLARGRDILLRTERHLTPVLLAWRAQTRRRSLAPGLLGGATAGTK